jgi:hypothetical protein
MCRSGHNCYLTQLTILSITDREIEGHAYATKWQIRTVGQNRIYVPYMTVYLVISLPKIPNICTIYDRIYSDFPAKNTVYMHHI